MANHKGQSRRRSIRRRFKIVAFSFFLVIFLLSSTMALKTVIESSKAKSGYSELQALMRQEEYENTVVATGNEVEAAITNEMELNVTEKSAVVEAKEPITIKRQKTSVDFSALKEINPDICVGAACYPEIHPESKNRVEDIAHLKEKVDCGAQFLTSQMFFDNEKFLNFVEMCRIKGIEVPIIAGIMPITNANQIKRSIELSNSSVPKKFFRIMERFGDDPNKMKQAGIIYATEQIIDLMANGINDIHIYTMNKPDVASQIMNGLSHIINE